MSATPSTMMPLGTPAPEFTLYDAITGKKTGLPEQKGSVATVVVFMCNHCPYVIHILPNMVAVAQQYKQQGVNFVAINANDVENYPDDSPVKMTELADAYNFNFPYLFDETQQTAKAYDAACTPDFFVFDKDLKCAYRGRFDAARPKTDTPVTGQELKAALDALVQQQPVPQPQKPSIGCNIKWKKN